MSITRPGIPNWVDLGTSDLATATRFYCELFGWAAHASPDPTAGGYTIFNKDGKPVAGAGPLFADHQPTAWSTYISTDDADAVSARVDEAGGTVMMEPFTVTNQGRMAVFMDPAGAVFSVWQAEVMPGAELFNVPGALCWNELTTRDPAGSKVFYHKVFGWEAMDSPSGQVTYTQWRVDGDTVAGMMPMDDSWPHDMPPHWMVYFAVEDCDDAVELAAELGGTVSVPPHDIPTGRFAVLTDPQGAAFSVIRLNT